MPRIIGKRRFIAAFGAHAAAMTRVDEIDADSGVSDQDLAGAGFAGLDLFPPHDVNIAALMDTDRKSAHEIAPVSKA